MAKTMKLRIDWDGETYWVVANGEQIVGHSHYGQAERSLWLMVGQKYWADWMKLAG